MRPRVWHLVLMGGLFASAAARSCVEFLRYGPYPAGEPYAFLFVASALLAGGPLVLVSFRIWQRHRRDPWPAIALSGRLAAIGFAVSVVGYIGALGMVLLAPTRLRIMWVFVAFVSVAATGFVAFAGAMELLVISAVREIRGRGPA